MYLFDGVWLKSGFRYAQCRLDIVITVAQLLGSLENRAFVDSITLESHRHQAFIVSRHILLDYSHITYIYRYNIYIYIYI